MGILGSINERQSGSSGVLLDNGDLVPGGPVAALHWMAHWGACETNKHIYNHSEKM